MFQEIKMKALYDERPEVLGSLGNGAYQYRWNISQVEVGNAENEWQCDEVTVWPTLTAAKITKAVIEEVWPLDEEQKLINEYNGAQMGIYSEEVATEKVEAYRTFLAERERLKAQVRADLVKIGIK